jgi:hypothetical protein
MPAVEELIAELRQAGREDSRGAFTLDRDKAREKMRLFQLPDPRAYVLSLVQAAVLRGATRLRFDIDADDMRLSFDGSPFTVEDFDQVYGSLLAAADTPVAAARRELALGLNAAMALNPRWVRVESGGAPAGAGAFLELRPGEPDRFGPLEPCAPGTRLHVKQRFRPGLVVQFLRNVAGTLAEEHLLRQRCRFASVEIDLEGERLDAGLALPGAAVSVPLEADGLRGVVGLSADPDAVRASVVLVTNGVRVTTHGFDDLLPGLVAVVEGSRLRKDVSQQNIVGDEAYAELVDAVRGRQVALLEAAVCRSLAEPEALPPERVRRLVVALLARLGSFEPFAALRRDGGEHFVLAVAPWTDLRGAPVSLGAVLAEVEAHRNVVYSRERSVVPVDVGGRTLLHLATDDQTALLRRLLEAGDRHLVDWTRRVRQAEQRAVNETLWRRRPLQPALPPHRHASRAPIHADGVRGEIGIAATEAEGLRLVLVHDGHVLGEREFLGFPFRGLEAVVEAGFTPNAVFDWAAPDTVYARAMLALVRAVVPLFDGLARDGRTDEWRSACLAGFLVGVTRKTWYRHALDRLGVPKDQARDVCAELGGAVSPRALLRPRPAARVEPHGARFARVVPCLAAAPLSVDDLIREAEARGDVLVIDPETAGIDTTTVIPEAAWRLVDRAAGRQPAGASGAADGRPIFLRTKVLDRLIDRLFAKKEVEVIDLGAGGVLAAALEFVKRPAVLLSSSFDALRSIWVEAGPVTGELGVLAAADEALDGTISLALERRWLGRAALGMPLRGLAAAVGHEGLVPEPDFSGAAEGEATGQVREALAAALPRLVAELVGADGTVADRRARDFLFGAATAVFPSPSFRQAYDALLRQVPDHAEADYRRLLELGAAASYALVDSTLKAKLDQDPPAAVRTVLGAMRAALVGSRPLPAVHPGAMAWLDALFPGEGSFADRVLAPLPVLREARLFEAFDGRPVSLGEVIDELRRSNRVLVGSGERLPVSRASDPLILLVDDWRAMGALECLAGKARLVHAKNWLDRRRSKLRAESIPRLEPFALEPDEALVRAPIGRGGLFGEVGLAAAHPATDENHVTIRLCKDRRPVSSEVWVSGVALRAVVNDDRLNMSPAWDAIVEDPTGEGRLEACHARVPELARALAAAWPGFGEIARATARRHVLDLLALLAREAGDGAAGLVERAPWCDLAALPVVRDSQGALRSIDDLRRRGGGAERPIAFSSPFEPEPGAHDPDLMVLHVDRHARLRLEQLAPLGLRFEDLSSLVARQRIERTAEGSEKTLVRLEELAEEWVVDLRPTDPDWGRPLGGGGDPEAPPGDHGDDPGTTPPWPPLEGEGIADLLDFAAELALIDAVRAELMRVREGNARLLAGVSLDAIALGDAPPSRAVASEGGQVLVNRRHPLVQAALGRHEDDPVLVSFLASAVYSELNRWLEEITDSDEERFHALLVERVAEMIDGGP